MPRANQASLVVSTNTLGSSMSGAGGAFSPKPTVAGGRLARGRDALFGRLGNIFLNASLSSSIAKSKPRRGVRICEEENDILEISTRAERVARGDLDLFYPEDYVPDPVIECAVCRYEAESDTEAGSFRIFNLPNGGWQLLCPTCEPPDPSWEFDRTVAVVDALLPPDLLQLVFLFLTERDTRLCAQICREWNDLSWTVLTLMDDSYFHRKLANTDKIRNVWILRVYLHDAATAESYAMELCDNLYHIDALSELQLTGVTGDFAISRLAQALKPHRFLQVLDVGACEFSHRALTALLSALEDNEAASLELILPKCCMDRKDHSYSTTAAAQQALATLVAGTRISASLV